MMLQCPTCHHPIIGENGHLRPDRTLTVNVQCRTCHTVYQVEIRELRATDYSAAEVESRMNATS